METKERTIIKVQILVDVPIEKAWDCWNNPGDIVKWNNASNDWHTPHAENDLRIGGLFNYRMESINGSEGFDFKGIYFNIVPYKLIEYIIGDGRKVKITFAKLNNKTKIIEQFESEEIHSTEKQRVGWQNILDNFKNHVEKI